MRNDPGEDDRVDRAVDFLIRHDALRLGDSPWTTYTDDDVVYGVDWTGLFPPATEGERDGNNPWDINGDDWYPEWDDEFRNEITEALGGDLEESATGESEAFDEAERTDWDRCAWYQPFHYFGYDWGIFIREECVRRIAVQIARHMQPSLFTGSTRDNLAKALWRAGLYVYFLHEHYHHKIESLGFRIHVVDQKSAYLPYHKNVYGPCLGKDEQLEEALANADAFHRLGDKPYSAWITKPVVAATRKHLRQSFPHDPPGYRKAVNYLTPDELFDAGENVLQARVREATLTPKTVVDDWDLAPRMTQSFFNIRSNIWVVVPRGKTPRVPTRGMPAATCRSDDLISLCKRAGYREVPGGKGSHVKLERTGSPMIIVPGNRKDVSPGAAKTTLRVLGHRLADLPDLLKGRMELALAQS